MAQDHTKKYVTLPKNGILNQSIGRLSKSYATDKKNLTTTLYRIGYATFWDNEIERDKS